MWPLTESRSKESSQTRKNTTLFSRQLVVVSKSMAKSAQFAVGGGLGIVHPVFHWLESTQVGKRGLQVFIGQVTIVGPAHNLVDLACLLDEASPHRLQK